MAQTITRYFNSSGTFDWVAPSDTTSVAVEGIGGGGAGARRTTNGNGGGGSGGGYAKLNAFTTTGSTKYTVVIGAGGNTANNANGTDTTFNSTSLIAKGGTTAALNNATGQSAPTAQTGDVVHDAGAGSNNGTSKGGGGGSSGGNAANGNAGTTTAGGAAPAGGGAGGAGAQTGNANGTDGSFPGGAGGGATRTAGTHFGGNGAGGQGILTYSTSVMDICAIFTGRASAGGVTVAGTVPNLTNLLAVALTTVQDSNHANYPVTSVKWNTSESFTKVRSDEATGNVRTEIWYLINPTVTSSDFVVATTGSLGETTATIVIFTQAKQSGQPDANNGANGSGTTPSVSLTTVADKSYVLSVACSEGAFSAYGSQAHIAGPLTDQSFENAAAASSVGQITPAGAGTYAYTVGSAAWAESVASFAPFVSAGGAAPPNWPIQTGGHFFGPRFS